jgi:hypothetical protein
MKRLLLLLMLVSPPVWAGWVELGPVGEGADAFTIYWDPATLRKTADGRRAWMMGSYEQSWTKSVPYQSFKSLTEVDCAGERTRTLQKVLYSGPMGTGETVGQSNDPTGWRVFIPGSVGDERLKAICNGPLK